MEPTLVFPLSLSVEHFAGIAAQTPPNRDADGQRLFRSDERVRSSRTCAGTAQEVECMKFPTRVLQQALKVAETLDVLQDEPGGVESDRPVLTVLGKQTDSDRRTARGPSFRFTPGCKLARHEIP